MIFHPKVTGYVKVVPLYNSVCVSVDIKAIVRVIITGKECPQRHTIGPPKLTDNVSVCKKKCHTADKVAYLLLTCNEIGFILLPSGLLILIVI